ncbi:type I-E CRISPR-associated protein Cse2/CasB [Sphingomonas sp. Mn802worker]|uniref:type I-E CRISPR-associated protein Cse2/CasB n=1 Tax=Sphingomonas sp. Mn802worker TaxID=629773 RepID=UPI0003819EE4|nr:type I-E CRISPR-associated protein Cse2/CasB [Sphingomonas sp. Mn802worker]
MASDPHEATAPKDVMASIGGQIAHLSAGDRAALRRIYLTGRPSADGIVIGLLHRAGVTVPDDAVTFRPWRLVVHAAALLSGTAAAHPHAKSKRLGTLLHDIGLSENRLLRLTSARGEALDAQAIRAARMLAQVGQRTINLWTLFDLVGNDEADAEAARLRIAQDYYAAHARSDEGNNQ